MIFVASNSLPSYQITASLPKSVLPQVVQELNYHNLVIIQIHLNIIFYLSKSSSIYNFGDEIFYTAQGTIFRLSEGNYFVEVLSNANQIRLYLSRSFIPISDYEELESLPAGSGTHTFSLVGTVEQQVAAQKIT